MHRSFNIDKHLTEQHWQPVFLFSKPSVSIHVCCSYIELSRSKLYETGDLQVGNWHVNCQYSSYDMIHLRALKSWQDGQLNLAHGTETNKWGKTKNKNRVAQKKTVRAIVREGSPRGSTETTGCRICETGRFCLLSRLFLQQYRHYRGTVCRRRRIENLRAQAKASMPASSKQFITWRSC